MERQAMVMLILTGHLSISFGSLLQLNRFEVSTSATSDTYERTMLTNVDFEIVTL